MGDDIPFDIPILEQGLPVLQPLYGKLIQNMIEKKIPTASSYHSISIPLDSHQKSALLKALPLVAMGQLDQHASTLSFFAIFHEQENAFKFFLEMISHWLAPRNKPRIGMVYSSDFTIEDAPDQNLTFCEISLRIKNHDTLQEIKHNWLNLKSEIQLGIKSGYHARRILEIKGHCDETKTGSIHERIAKLLTRWPDKVDNEIIIEMQHLLVMCPENFKILRSSQHLSRMISIKYAFRKKLLSTVKFTPNKRHFHVKLLRTRLHGVKQDKSVLALIIGMNFICDKEIIEERHLLNAVQSYIPHAQPVEGSFFSHRRGNENVGTLYIELEKSTGELFTNEEVLLLKNQLPNELKDRIEQLVHPVFMPRNEEEIVRNILSLSTQIRYLHDLPQVIISFDAQTVGHLFFNVILVRVLKPMQESCQEILKRNHSNFEYIHDRTKTLGQMRKKYIKEGTVFCVKLSKDQFLRRDNSIDLYKARQTVVNELVKMFGEIRDFNGGLISKQNERFNSLLELLKECPKYNELVLENFFYSLAPDVMRTVVEPSILKTFFLLLQDSVDCDLNEDICSLKLIYQPEYVLAMVKSEDKAVKEALNRSLTRCNFEQNKLASSFIIVYDNAYMGYLCLSDDFEIRQQFAQSIQNSITMWNQRKYPPMRYFDNPIARINKLQR